MSRHGPALLIDTSTRYLIFARVEKDKEGSILAKTTGTENEDTIDEAVAELFPQLTEMSEIWLGEGPGSFVGLRSSFAYVRMLTMLGKIPCRTFLSSRLWRHFFGVQSSDWFLMRTNAKLFYAERYTPEREAHAVDVTGAANLHGEKFCFSDSWLPAKAQSAATTAESPAWQEVCFKDATLAVTRLGPETLVLSAPVSPDDLTPLYGHELNFALAQAKTQ